MTSIDTPRSSPPPRSLTESNVRVALALVLLFFGALAVRAAWIQVPMRYDESYTFLNYAARGPRHVLSHYERPNNHVLHTLLVSASTRALGSSAPWAIRLPALLAGALVPVASAWLALRTYGRTAAAFTAAMTIAWPVLVSYSVNARGYGVMVALAVACGAVTLTLARTPSRLRAAFLGLLGALGLWVLPVMAIPLLGLELYLLQEAMRAGRVARQERLVDVLVSGTTAGALAGLAYLPIFVTEGASLVFANKYVAPRPWGWFLRDLPADAAAVAAHWLEGVPVLVVVAVAGGLLADHLSRGRTRMPLLAPLLLVSLTFVLARRNTGYPRVWLFALPFVLVSASGGLASLAERGSRRVYARAAPALGVLIAGMLLAALVTADPVRRSTDTGAFPEGPKVAEALASRMGPDDTLITDQAASWPLAYYLSRLRGRHPPSDGGTRTWIVLHQDDPRSRSEVLREMSAKGIPAERPGIVLTEGRVRVLADPPLDDDGRL